MSSIGLSTRHLNMSDRLSCHQPKWKCSCQSFDFKEWQVLKQVGRCLLFEFSLLCTIQVWVCQRGPESHHLRLYVDDKNYKLWSAFTWLLDIISLSHYLIHVPFPYIAHPTHLLVYEAINQVYNNSLVTAATGTPDGYCHYQTSYTSTSTSTWIES